MGENTDLTGDVSVENKGMGDIVAKTVSIKQGSANAVKATTVDLTMGSATNIEADEITLRQAGAQTVRGGDVIARQAGILRLEAEKTETTQTAVAFSRADSLTAITSQIGGIWANQATLDQSAASVLVAPGGAPNIDQSAIGALVTGKAQLRNSIVGLAFTGKLDGEYTVLFGPQAALAFGAAFGAVLAVLMRLMRRN